MGSLSQLFSPAPPEARRRFLALTPNIDVAAVYLAVAAAHPDGVGVLDEAWTQAEVDFSIVLERYKRECRRPCPRWCEVLALVVALGYRLAGESPAVPAPLIVAGSRAAASALIGQAQAQAQRRLAGGKRSRLQLVADRTAAGECVRCGLPLPVPAVPGA